MASKQAPEVKRIQVVNGAVYVFGGGDHGPAAVAAPNGEYMVIRHTFEDGSVEIVIVQEGPKIYGGGQ